MKKDFFKDSKIKFPAYEPWISKEDKKITLKNNKKNNVKLNNKWDHLWHIKPWY